MIDIVDLWNTAISVEEMHYDSFERFEKMPLLIDKGVIKDENKKR